MRKKRQGPRATLGASSCRESRRRRRVVGLLEVPKDAVTVVLAYCDAETVVAVRSSSLVLREWCEDWAQGEITSRGWRMADGLGSFVERLATRVCVFEPASLRATVPSGKRGAVFSPHASRVDIRSSGRYLVAGLQEPSLLPKKRSALAWELSSKRRRSRDVSFELVVSEPRPLSSIYVGVADKSWIGCDQRAVRSDRAWLLDLRRGRFVHDYPAFDSSVAEAHGSERAKLFATTDDVVRDGDRLGVRLGGEGVLHFYKNGRRLAFAAGGRDDRASGWGRPIPLDADLVPVVEVHARLDRTSVLKLRLRAWGERSASFAARVAPHAPGLAGLASFFWDLAGLAGAAPSRTKAFCDALALSVALSALWKAHFYDRRRPRRSRRGLRTRLQTHMAKCLLVAAATALFASTHPSPVDRAHGNLNRWLCFELAAELACLRCFVADRAPATSCGFLKFLLFIYLLPGAAAVLVALTAESAFSPAACSRRHDAPAALFLESASTFVGDLDAEIQQWQTQNHPTLIQAIDDALKVRTVEVRVFDAALATRRGLAAEVAKTAAGLLPVLACHSSCFDVFGTYLKVTPFAFDRAGSLDLGASPLHVAWLDLPLRCLRGTDALFPLRVAVYLAFSSWVIFALFVKVTLLMFGVTTLFGFDDFGFPGWLCDARC